MALKKQNPACSCCPCVATLTITVVDPCGNPIKVMDSLGAVQGGTTIYKTTPGTRSTVSATGIYTWNVTAAGTWTITAATPGGTASTTVTAVCGSTATATLTLAATTTLSGTVEGCRLTGHGLAGLTVYAFTAGGFGATVVTDASGHYTLDVTSGCIGPFSFQLSKARWTTLNLTGMTGDYGYNTALGTITTTSVVDPLTPDPSYACLFASCDDPFLRAATLHLPGSISVAMTYASGTWVGCRYVSGSTRTVYAVRFDAGAGTPVLETYTQTGTSCPSTPTVGGTLVSTFPSPTVTCSPPTLDWGGGFTFVG